jgi:SEC-C motif
MRRKPGQKETTKWIHPKPDEVASFGPLTIIRYGRHVLLSNKSTPEQHQEFLARSAEANTRIHAELGERIGQLQNTIRKYDPILLMHRAAYILLPLFLKHRSESEFSHEESFALPGVEYLQYLIARTETGTSGTEPNEEEWAALWSMTLETLRLTHQYLFTRKTQSSPPSPIDDLCFLLDSERLGVRVQRYPLFMADFWRDSLTPYAPWIKDLYGISVDELVNSLLALQEYHQSGVLERYEAAITVSAALMENLASRGYDVTEDAPEIENQRTREALESPEFAEAYAEAQEKLRLTLTPAIFDMTDLTRLPKPVLATLSVSPGESVLRDPELKQHDDLSPLSTSPLHFKPLLQVNERFYSFYHSGFEDHVPELIAADLVARKPSDATAMARRHSDRIEEVAAELLSRVLEPDFVFRQMYYPNPDQPGDLTELDVLMGVDDLLFLVEVKSGGLSPAGSRGAPKSLAGDLHDLIIAGQRQSERAERYLKSQPEAPFYDQSGKNVVHRVRIADYRRVFRLIVTREFLSWVGAKIAVLSILDPGLSKSFPWHVSLDDLRVVAELFAGKALQFAHFLEQRLQASAETALSQHDEIDHIALYFRLNQYHDLNVRGVDFMSFDSSYTKGIDHYFASRSAGEAVAMPGQRISANTQRLVDALSASHLRGRFEAASAVLSMGQQGRREFDEMLGALEARRNAGREPSIHLSFSDQACFSISSVSDPYFAEETVRCGARMRLGRRPRWIVIHLECRGGYRVQTISVITPRTFSEAEIARGTAYLDEVVARARLARKIGRNEQCPCGSGLKYKACHERR